MHSGAAMQLCLHLFSHLCHSSLRVQGLMQFPMGTRVQGVKKPAVKRKPAVIMKAEPALDTAPAPPVVVKKAK